MIFRPWHEFDGDWFWWGRNNCTPEELKELYRFTVTYLRDTCGVHNFLYCFSPDINFTSAEEYLRCYPGDEYVDIVAMDNYWLYRFEEKNLDHAHLRLKVISDYAKSVGKIAALSETGQGPSTIPNGSPDGCWKSIYGYPNEARRTGLRRCVAQQYVRLLHTLRGTSCNSRFPAFLNDERVVTAWPYDWLGMYYHLTD